MKNKHITDAERLEIEHGLRNRKSINEIAVKVGKHRSTISREILSRQTTSNKGAFGRLTNRCIYRKGCKKIQICEDKPNCVRRCTFCRLCNSRCQDFKEEVCEKLSNSPYVCNGCKEESKCVLRKQYYLHNLADQQYQQVLKESRSGANISEKELLAMNKLFSPLIKRGQSVHHILVNNPDRFTVNEKTIYRYIADGLLSVKNGDMPRICKLRPRRKKSIEHKVDSKCRIGRTYKDYHKFIENSPALNTVEIDSVIGRVGGKVLLTLMFTNCGLMLAFIRDRNNSQSVIDIFNQLWETAGVEQFKNLFGLLLTDNGSEFSNPKALEFDEQGNRRSHLFYCDPRAAYQKPHVERNHELLRQILPKGTSFDELKQKDINKMLSHVNSYSRPVLNDKAPYDLFSFMYGSEILKILGLERIHSNQIILKPALLKK